MKKILLLFVVLLIPSSTFATTDIFTSSGVWTAPAGVTLVQVNAWGAGGSGSGCCVTNSRPTGGGGGGFAGLTNFSVTPGNTYTVSVGLGGNSISDGNGNAGGDSMFSASSTLLAKGGLGGISSTTVPTPSLGGQSSAEFGSTVFSGGNGGAGSGALGDHGGGGGGGGGGTTQNGSTGLASLGGGTGGSGGSLSGGSGGNGGGDASGNPGSILGGGGGGSGISSATSGAGARGEVDIIYTLPSTVVFMIKTGNFTVKTGQIIIKN